jgi:hypothetical protein
MRSELADLFRLAERIRLNGYVPLDEGKRLAGPYLLPLARVNFLRIERERLIAGSRMLSLDKARRLRLMMGDFLAMKPVLEAWDAERAGKDAPVRRRKPIVVYYLDVAGLGRRPFPVHSSRLDAIANRLVERGLLEKTKSGVRNIYRLSDWLRAIFQVLLRKE